MTFSEPNSGEKKHFRWDNFPAVGSDCREFIFQRTGFASKPLNMRDWYLFNASMNKGLELGIADHELQVLSLMDHSLSEVKRGRDLPHMHEIVADSTAAHSKQVMHIIQDMVHRAFPNHVPAHIEQFRKDAILGAWVHDMGEIVTELTTASEVFLMNPSEKKLVSAAKGACERDLFIFGCDLAEACIAKGKPELFHETIERMRDDIQGSSQTLERIYNLQRSVKKTRERLDIPTANVTEHLLEMYDRAEEPKKANDLLHPFVKTLESVEGVRYLQRNSILQPHTRMELATSHQIVRGSHRAERRLPALFDVVKNIENSEGENEKADFDKLAMAAAAFTYGSIARQFTPREHDFVSLAPPFIVRDPDPRAEIETHMIIPEYRAQARGDTASYLKEHHAKQDNSGYDTPIWSRAQAGEIYRAAEAAVRKPHPRFRPTTPCLIDAALTPEIPEILVTSIEQHRRTLESGKGGSKGRSQ